MTVFTEEKLRNAEQRIRDGLVTFADFLVGNATAEQIVAAFCPADVPAERRWSYFADLVYVVEHRGPDRSLPLPHEAEVDLDYMTGARK